MTLRKIVLMHTTAMCIAVGLVWSLASTQACAGKNVNTIVADTAEYGTLMMKGVKATATAVDDARQKKLISDDDARKALTVLLGITTKAEEASKYLSLIVDAQGTPAAADAATKLQAALDLMDSELFKVLVPIKDETLKANVVSLVAEISKTIGLINREVLGRIK